MNTDTQIDTLSFTVSAHVSRPVAEVYEAVADPDQLSKYFTTGGARGRLEAGSEVTWDFHDFPGAFPVRVLESDPPHRIVIEWEAAASATEDGWTTTVFEFEPLDGDTRTLVTVTESSWQPTDEGAKRAFGNCEGWTGMLAALKVWVEHGINLREGFYK
ncbi:MAG: SRPBCC family protein [Nocardioides sp.]